MTHANAPLTPEGRRRRLAHLVVEEGWPVRRVAERFQVSPATASRWVGRYRAGQPMEDRSCRPHHSPGRLARRTERRIIALRLNRRWGPHRIAYHLGQDVLHRGAHPDPVQHAPPDRGGSGYRAGALTDGAQRPPWPRTAPRPAPAVGAARSEAIGTSTTR